MFFIFGEDGGNLLVVTNILSKRKPKSFF